MMFDQKSLGELKEAITKWEKEHSREFASERKKEEEFIGDSGIIMKRLYTPLDLANQGFDYLKNLGLPGEYPYTRGITSTMYRGAIYGISQYSGYSTPEAANKLWKEQVSRGLYSIHLAFDLPTQLGMDPDDPRAEAEVGKVGVSMCSLRDFEVAFDGISLENIHLGQILNGVSTFALAAHIAMAEQQGVDLKKLRGFQQNDILKEYSARGLYVYPLEPAVRMAVDVIAYVCNNLPLYQGIHICCAHLSEKGANPVQEGAYGLSNMIAYLEAAIQRGIDVDKIAPAITFLASCSHGNFFEHIAKIRAIRRLYARILRERFKAKDPRSLQLRLLVSNKGTSITREQYLNNIARNGIAAVCAVMSGVQLLDLRGYDEQFGIPTSEAITTNIRIQQIVAYETGITDVVDPLAGSYFLENLTSEFEGKMWEKIEAIDKMGGTGTAIGLGYEQRELEDEAYKWQKDFEAGRIWRVGVNVFRSEEEEKPSKVYRADPKIGRERVAAVRELRAKRDNKKVRKSLDELKATALLPGTAENNLVPPVLEAVKNYATIGEIANVFREVWGDSRGPSIF
jgi:methylmalonyl-CoA mutase, N-terminal domain